MYLVLVFFLSCNYENSRNCDIDFRFESEFRGKIELLKKSEIEKESVKISEKLDALFFLSAVTNTKSSIRDIHVPLYPDIKSFKKDVYLWEQWYKENKCSFTYEKADSLASKFTW